MPQKKIFVGWTTLDSAPSADRFAVALVATRLAACVLVDGPVTSHYVWQGKQECAKEWRVWIKFPARHARKINTWLSANHPYATPQWLAVEAATMTEPYRQWVLGNTRKPATTRKKK